MSGRTRIGATPSKLTSSIILILAGIAFILPLGALGVFAFRPNGQQTGFTLDHLRSIFNSNVEYIYDQLFQGVEASLIIAVVTVAIILILLLPTMVLTELRFPRVRQVLEFVCLLPITIPTVVLALGFIPVYQVLWRSVGNHIWLLAFAIGILVLPYAYRPIQANISALDMTTLSEASRSLGAGWFGTLWNVILPNLRRGILTASLLTVSVVLGEYTIAAFLSLNTFQTALYQLESTDPYVSALFALAAIVFVFILLVVIGFFGSMNRSRKARS